MCDMRYTLTHLTQFLIEYVILEPQKYIIDIYPIYVCPRFLYKPYSHPFFIINIQLYRNSIIVHLTDIFQQKSETSKGQKNSNLFRKRVFSHNPPRFGTLFNRKFRTRSKAFNLVSICVFPFHEIFISVSISRVIKVDESSEGYLMSQATQ